MAISKFKKESIYDAYCVDCPDSPGQCCCVIQSQVVSELLEKCPQKEGVEKMLYGQVEERA